MYDSPMHQHFSVRGGQIESEVRKGFGQLFVNAGAGDLGDSLVTVVIPEKGDAGREKAAGLEEGLEAAF